MSAACETCHLSLRPVTADDTEFLIAVYASVRADELAQVPWSGAQKDAFVRAQFAAQKAFYESAAHYPGAEFHVIVVDNVAAGRLYVHRRAAEIRVMEIALLPEFRGRGIGSRLLQELLEEGARTGRVVSIHVETFNPARRLYERLGFREVATHGVYHLLEAGAPGAATC